ncbi:MAG: alpha/beta fold hydrolase, partial [Dongiaceae bacterium]
MRAAVNGIEIAYRMDGPAQAPVVMLSHSLATTMDMWKPQLPVLARDCRVLSYDMRGHGDSSARSGAYS